MASDKKSISEVVSSSFSTDKLGGSNLGVINNSSTATNETPKTNNSLLQTKGAYSGASIYLSQDPSGYLSFSEDPNNMLKQSYDNNTPLYRSASGELKTSPSAAITLDKKSGDISVHVPKFLKNSEIFNDYYTENLQPTLQKLSAAYKADQNYKFPKLDENNKETGETQSVQDILNELNDTDVTNKNSITYIANAAGEVDKVKQSMKAYAKQRFGKDFNFTDYDAIQDYNVALGKEIKDDTLQSIPDIPEANFFRMIEGYDSDKKVAKLGNIMKDAWNRDKVSDDDIKILWSALQGRIMNSDGSDTANIARSMALLQFMEGRDPGVNFLRGTAETIGNAAKYLAKSLADFVVTVGTASNYAVNNLSKGMQEVVAGITGEEAAYKHSRYDDVAEQNLKAFNDTWTQRWQADINEMKLVNDWSANVSGIANFLGDLVIASMVGTGVSGVLGAGLGAVGTALGDATAAATKTARYASMADSLTKDTMALTNGAKIITNLLGPSQSASLYSSLARLSAIASEKATSKLAQSALEVMIGSFTDAIIFDGDKFRDVLTSNTLTTEGRDLLMSEFAQNVQFGTLGELGKKFFKEASSVSPGLRAISHNSSKIIANLNVKFGDLMEEVRVKVHGFKDWEDMLKKSKSSEKMKTLALNHILRDLKRVVADQDWVKVIGKDRDELVEQLTKIENRVAEGLKKGESVLNDIIRQNQGTINYLVRSGSFPNLSAAYKNLNGAANKIFELEKATASTLRKGRLFTEETGNYVGAMVDRERVKAKMEYERKIGELTTEKEKAYMKTLADDQRHIETFRENASYELRAAANQYVNYYRQFYYDLEDAASSKIVNVKDPEVLKTMRESGEHGVDGELYAKVQRLKEKPKFQATDDSFRRGTTIKYQETVPGATGDFVDPNLVVTADLQQIAGLYNAQQLTKIYLNNGMANVVVDSTVAKFVETSEALRKQARTEIFNIVSEALNDETLTMSVRDILTHKATDVDSGGARRTRDTLFRGSAELSDDQVTDIFNRFTDESGIERTLFDETGALKGDVPDGIRATMEDSMQRLDGQLDFIKDTDGKIRINKVNFGAARKLDTTLDNRLMRTYINNSPNIITDEGVVKEIRKAIKGKKDFNRATIYRSNLDNYAKYAERVGKSQDDIQESLENFVDNIIQNVIEKKGATLSSAKGLASMFGKGNDEEIMRYLILNELSTRYDDIKPKMNEVLREDIGKIADTSKLSVDEQNEFIEEIQLGIEDIIEMEYSRSVNVVNSINPALLDQQKIYNRVKQLNEQISGYKEDYNYVASTDMTGRVQYIKVDPSLGYYLKSANIQRGELGRLAQLNYLQSKIYRMGQTGISITSMMSQMFRDTGNAIIVGGVTHTIMGSQKLLAETFGENVAQYMKQYTEEVQSMLRATAEQTGRELNEVMADYELGLLKSGKDRMGYGRAYSPAATETDEYRRAKDLKNMKYADGKPYDRKAYQKIGDTIDSMTERIGKVNEMREQYLRNLVYANAYQDGVKRGLTVENARYHAQYMMDNATTNFSRPLVHLEGLRRSVPYLGAAINGTKSFWRLWALDPVGVTGRIVGGLIMPTIALTMMSLNSEENRKAWKNLTEYQKDENICFALNGQIFTIPIPQELAVPVNLVRNTIEKLYDVNDKAFTSLLVNDLVGLVPLDLSGFVDVDGYKLFDSDFQDHMSKGFIRVWSQVAPPLAKSAMMYITGVDPYTLKGIDVSHVQFDENTGEKTIVDNTSGNFARQFAKFCNGMGINMSSPMAQKLLNSIFGNANQRIMDGVTGLLQAVVPGGEGEFSDFGGFLEQTVGTPTQKFIEAAGSPFYVNDYDQAQAAWRQAISYLFDKKNEMLHDEKVGYQQAMTNLRNATTVKEKEAARTALRNITDPFYKEVLEVVTNLKDQYNETFTGNKFASVLALLNLAESTVTANPASDLINTEEYNQGKVQAIQTMQQYGFPSSDDSISIFGEYKVSKSTGEIYTRFTDPIAILDMENAVNYASDIHSASIDTIVKEAGVWEKRKKWKAERQEAINNKDYDKADEIAKDWNKRLMNTLDPYISKYTPQAVVNDYDMLDKLSDMFFVPFKYTEIKDKRGYYIKTPEDLNKPEGFIRNYIKEIYGLRD